VHTPLIIAAARTDRGRVRSRNDDTVLADMHRGLVAVADGLGGRPAGDTASRLAIETLAQNLSTLSSAHEVPRPVALHCAFTRANAHVFAMASRIPGYAGMGTTLVCGWFISTAELGLQLIVAHVGDSRLYRYRVDGEPTLLPLTRDHTSAQQLVDEGLYSSEDIRHLPQRHILTNAVGVEPEVDIDLLTVPVQSRDLVLLCSDGLSNMLDDAEICALIDEAPRSSETELARLAQALIDAANARGGHDNISVALATPASASTQT
jgi:protein phosphatase